LTILLFRGDLHMREFDATVVSVEGNFVVLDARAGSEVSEG
jgi:Ser-tRNA(Ala) deacylase AlaX